MWSVRAAALRCKLEIRRVTCGLVDVCSEESEKARRACIVTACDEIRNARSTGCCWTRVISVTYACIGRAEWAVMQFMKLRGSDGGGSVRLVLGSTVSCCMDATISAVMVVRLR